MTRTISPCRPGHGASCALCCGSHNFAASPETIDAHFARRRDFYRGFSPSYLAALAGKSRSAMTGSYHVSDEDPMPGEAIQKIFDDCTRCPFIALEGDKGIIGCVLHNAAPGEGRLDCVRSYSGKRFHCEVHDTLRDVEVRYAASLMRDWYHYSILIHSAPLLREVMELYPSPETVPAKRAARLREELTRRLYTDGGFHRIQSYFG